MQAIMRMKVSVMQHCKACGTVIKGGNVAEHRLKCMTKQDFETRKIKTKTQAERCNNNIIDIDENDQVGQATNYNDDASLDSSKQSINPLDQKIRNYSNNVYIHPGKTNFLQESKNKIMQAIIKDFDDYLGDPDDIKEGGLEKHFSNKFGGSIDKTTTRKSQRKDIKKDILDPNTPKSTSKKYIKEGR